MPNTRHRYNLEKDLGIPLGPETDALPALDPDGTQNGAFSILEVVHNPGIDFVRKWPEVPVTDEFVECFDFFKSQLPNYPYLQHHFPKTVFMDKPKGRYFLQERIEANPGQGNMSGEVIGTFDLEQIDQPEIMADLIGITADGLRFARDTAANPDIGKLDGEGWMIEVHNPENFLKGRLNGDQRDTVYLLDVVPMLPLTWEHMAVMRQQIPETLNHITRQKFGASLADFSAEHGLPDVEAIAALPNPLGEGAEVLDLAAARESRAKKTGGSLVHVANSV